MFTFFKMDFYKHYENKEINGKHISGVLRRKPIACNKKRAPYQSIIGLGFFNIFDFVISS